MDDKKEKETGMVKKTPAGDAPKKKITITISREDLDRMRLAQEDLDFIADSKEALLAKTTPVANVILYALILFFVIALGWAGIAQLDEVTRGVGKVVPASQVQIIQNLEGGILSNILVKEGDHVKKGQILAKLDETQFASNYQEAYAKYLAIQADIARLEAETQGEKNIEFPSAVKKNKNLVAYEQKLFESRKHHLESSLENLKRSYKLVQHELKITRPLVSQGILSKIELLRLEREANRIKTQMESYEDDFNEKASLELTRQKSNLSILEESLKALKDRQTRTILRSPADGIVKQIYINTLGGVVRAGVPIMEVVPMDDQLIIEAQVLPNKIAFIEPGQKAVVKITAYDYSIYGGLNAKVTHVSADTSVDRMGRSFYEVTLKTDKNYLGSKKGNFPIMPGMTASIDIMTGKKSVLHYLLKPILRAKEKALRER